MKNLILITLSVFITIILEGQELRISVAPTNNNAFYYQPVYGARYYSKPGISTSLNYIPKSEKRISLSYSLNYKIAQVEIEPWIDPFKYTTSVSLISLNIEPVLESKRHFYFSLGPTIDVQVKKDPHEFLDDQTGLGITGGFGKKFMLKSILFINVEPRIWIHNIVPMQNDSVPLRLTIFGLNLGIGFWKKRS